MKILALLIGMFISMSASAVTSQFKLDLLFAKRGDVSAQFSVATAYEFGTDIDKDLKQSFEWYMKAANQSHAPSQYKVGYFYENGLGVEKNIDSAMLWYKKAKANGSNQASKRLNNKAFAKDEKTAKESRLKIQARLEREEKEDAARKAKIDKQKALANQRALAKKKQTETKKVKEKIVKKTTPKVKPAPVKKSVAVKIPDILKVVLNNKWKNKHGAADYLPSASTTCLESGDNELTCFSSEKSRKVKTANVRYTTKSSIFGFKSNGSFKVIYNYNGISISGAKSKSPDIYGLTMREGWQEPAIAVNCQASDRKNITCNRSGVKVKFNL